MKMIYVSFQVKAAVAAYELLQRISNFDVSVVMMFGFQFHLISGVMLGLELIGPDDAEFDEPFKFGIVVDLLIVRFIFIAY